MKIADVLSDPSKFTTIGDAVDKYSRLCWSGCQDAVAWDLFGAMAKCINFGGDPWSEVYNKLVLAIHPSERSLFSLRDFSRNHSYEEVLQLAKDAGV